MAFQGFEDECEQNAPKIKKNSTYGEVMSKILVADFFLGHNQGPQNLYGRDSKFHPTFNNGTEKHQFSVPLLMTLSSN